MYMQLSVRIPKHLVSMLDEHVDGTRYRSRAQLIEVIVTDWLEEKKPTNQSGQTRRQRTSVKHCPYCQSLLTGPARFVPS